MTDDNSHEGTADLDGPGAGNALLGRMLGLVAVAHLAAAVADVLPGGAGAVCAVADAVLALLLTVGVVAVLLVPVALRPSSSAESALAVVEPAAVVGVCLAALVSGLRAGTIGQPWTGMDLVLAVFAGSAVRTPRLFVPALAGAPLAWAAAFAVGAVDGISSSAAGWALLVGAVLAAAGAAVLVRQSQLELAVALDTAHRTAGQQAVTDPLTGVTNRRGLELMALPMVEHARRQGEAVHCLFIDLDAFRSVNESLGRGSGDDVLAAVCEAILGSVRATDVVGRWAGDQFVVIGPGTGTSPLEMERRVRSHLADRPPVPADVWDGQVSIGAATLVPWDDGNIDSLLRRAEEDMQLRRSLRRQSRARSMGVPDLGAGPVGTERRGQRPKPPKIPPSSPSVPGDH